MKVKAKTSLVTVFSIVAVFSLTAGIVYHFNQNKGQTAKLDKPAKLSHSEVIELNNKGVRALNSENFKEAIAYFGQAVKAEPTYELGKKNLVNCI